MCVSRSIKYGSGKRKQTAVDGGMKRKQFSFSRDESRIVDRAGLHK